ncbi:MAG: hypothetical protein GXO91_08500 [FCB group bacterium]|nr:hypothetical protein [FCB group bacterium]
MYGSKVQVVGIILIFILGCTGTPDQHQSYLARAGDQTLDLESFKSDYSNFLTFTHVEDNLMSRNAFVKNEIEKMILTTYVDTSGFSELPEIKASVTAATGQLILNQFYQKELADPFEVSDADIREAFRRSKIKIHARHLYARSIEEAWALKNRLEKGATFETLARETFQDSTLANSGGDLGYFTYDEMDPAFEDAAYALEDGQISDPVKTAWGYSILQVIDRDYEPFITEQDYQLHKADFALKVKNRQLKKRVQEYTDKIAGSMDLKISDADLRLLYENLDSIFTQENISIFRNKGLRNIRLKTRYFDWDFAQLTEKLRLTRDNQRRQVTSTDDLREMLLGLSVREEIFNRIEASGWLKTPEFETALQERRTRRILTLLVSRIQAAQGDTASEVVKRQLYIDFINNLKDRTTIEVNKELLSSFIM